MILHTLARLCLLCAIPCLLAFPVAVAAFRWQWWALQQSLDLLRVTFFSGLLILAIAMLVALLAMLKRDLPALKAAAIAFGLISIPTIGLSLQALKGSSLPRIHDITTDTREPPQFNTLLSARGPDSNPLDYPAETLAPQQQAAYPYVKPIITQLTPDQALQRAAATAERLGWKVVAKDSANGVIEAVDSTPLWGFKDDIAIRIRATGNGSRVDLRSVSRVGVSDLGANAARIKQFIEAFH